MGDAWLALGPIEAEYSSVVFCSMVELSSHVSIPRVFSRGVLFCHERPQ